MQSSKDIEIDYANIDDELIISLSKDGVEYLQNILNQLRDAEVDSHWHVDDFSGWLGGNVKHLIIMKK